MHSRHSRNEHRQTLISHRNYQLWANTVARMAKTPRRLEKPRSAYSDLEFSGLVLQEHKEDIIRLWETFTKERGDISRYLMEPKREAMVYLLGFHLSNQARLSGILDRTEFRHRLLSTLSQAESLRLIDIGCGTGALSLLTAQELWSYREALPIEWELIDKSQAFLDMTSQGIEFLQKDAKPITRRQKLDEFFSRELTGEPHQGLAWYQLGYVWNEIKHQPKTTQLLLRYLQQGLTQGKRVLTLLEPASQDLSRDAMELRDVLVDMGYVALYPCPHSAACPMLERTRDWCYSEFVWEQPPLMKKVDRYLKIDRQRIGVSGYVFVSPDLAASMKLMEPAPIVVGRPVERAAKNPAHQDISYLLCKAEVELDKIKADKASIELMRGQVYRNIPLPKKEKKPEAVARGPQKPRNKAAPRRKA